MRKIDSNRLTNVVRKNDKVVARCPACHARGRDVTGNNLVVYPNGQFACMAYPGSKEHNRHILGLVGLKACTKRIGYSPFTRVVHPPSTTIQVIGRIGRVSETAPTVGNKNDTPLTTRISPHCLNEPDKGSVEAARVETPTSSSARPKVPQAILDALERYRWLPDGRVVDITRLDVKGNPTPVNWPRCYRKS